MIKEKKSYWTPRRVFNKLVEVVALIIAGIGIGKLLC